ncbi:hypothetical protein EV363DRAFT_1168896 [Boletus edulis]|uniref:DUF6830 domain-containing protein n=2 Tax=Boletus edulis BED1 TaxID=1328754 RepID=A0AAD4BYP1_BOLED|nr:hypothetical protein EV363DRAFT_1194371 [Boletus edulis]KAF8429854.1 hypothetical protein L210DRAFT_3418527 [Boletus edulis BED1]KAF8121474.1 hypothetical protein EV363DRAFT_1185648 [Boletus edulis]KAF8129458.1 hypothetical protein EV363DRAFT_1168896 [Boletus edulis]KAF8437722.1 hypothetical protein L210DRAFT_3405541 [Boletus edulis BED1]
MPNCPRCLKFFLTEHGAQNHRAQPRSACHDNNYRYTLEIPRLSVSPEPPAEYHDVNVPSPPHSEPPPPTSPDLDVPLGLPDDDSVRAEDARPFPAAQDPHLWVRDYFEGASVTYGKGDTFLGSFRRDQYSEERKSNLYYPFASSKDWTTAKFLSKSKLSMALVDEYLSLDVTKDLPLSFHTARDLRSRIEMLPPGPQWKYRVVSSDHQTKDPVHLYYRDPLDCVKLLFNNPFFADKMEYAPYKLYMSAERDVRVYSEWMSSDGAWEMQKKIPVGATLCGVILSSDKTHITNICGGRVAHPLLISLANIKMDARNKAAAHGFLLLALLPIAEFVHELPRMRSVLDARLFHHCLDIVLEPLKQAMEKGTTMPDPLGNLRYCFTPIASYILDTPEAMLEYFAACEEFRLSGVSLPFWRDWLLASPHLFLTPEALHHWHREFWDHDVCWCRIALGDDEIDFRFSVLPKITGIHHFRNGITKLKQVGGRTQRDVQRYLVAVIAGGVPPRIVTAIRALMEFRYLAQAPAITSRSRDNIGAALRKFHDHKQAILDAGLRKGKKRDLDHFYIPKLELIQSVVPSITQAGCPLQWSADTTEHAHIEVVKEPASMTNHHDYDAQVCRALDRDERCRLFDAAIRLQTAINDATVDTDEDRDETCEDLESICPQDVLRDLWTANRQSTNFFDVARKESTVNLPPRTIVAGFTAIHLNFDPIHRRQSIDEVARQFQLPDLRAALADYVKREGRAGRGRFHTFGRARQSGRDASLPFSELQIWHKVRLQQKSYHFPDKLGSTFTINAHPPGEDRTWKFGRYDAAILQVDQAHQWPLSGLTGHNVVLVRLIMCPACPKRGHTPWATRALVYAERLDVVYQRGSETEPTTGLHVLRMAKRASGENIGEVFPLDQLRSYAHIVPRFGRVADNRLTHSNSIYGSKNFFLNKYFDKDFFYSISRVL